MNSAWQYIGLAGAIVAGSVLLYGALRMTYPVVDSRVSTGVTAQLDPMTGWRADVTRKLDLLLATSCTCPPSGRTR